jgi:hypothetical protein
MCHRVLEHAVAQCVCVCVCCCRVWQCTVSALSLITPRRAYAIINMQRHKYLPSVCTSEVRGLRFRRTRHPHFAVLITCIAGDETKKLIFHWGFMIKRVL